MYVKTVGGKDYRMRQTQTEISEQIGYNVRTVQRNIYALEKEDILHVVHGKISISALQYEKIKHYITENLL